MSGPAWKDGPSGVVVDAQERGGEVPPRYGIAWMGAQNLETRLGYPQRLDMHQTCSRGRSRRCLGILSRRVPSGSPGCASAIFGRGTGLTPGPGSMPSTGANHAGKL